MTVEELKHIFRFQMTEDQDFKPKDTVEFVLLKLQDRVPRTHSINDFEGLLNVLEGYNFDGYRDRTPIFVAPEE